MDVVTTAGAVHAVIAGITATLDDDELIDTGRHDEYLRRRLDAEARRQLEPQCRIRHRAKTHGRWTRSTTTTWTGVLGGYTTTPPGPYRRD